MSAEYLTCTKILYLIIISGISLNYILRINISIAIVDMLDQNTTNNTNKFDWTIIQKNEVLGSFFWGYLGTMIIGGRLAEMFGARKVHGIGILGASVATVLFPWLARLHFYCAILARVVVGLFLGITFPSIYALAKFWIPPADRSKFTSNMAAQGLGVAIFLPIGGFMIPRVGWECVFYVTGGLGLIWSLAWFYLVYDSPDVHPRISFEEKLKIQSKLKLVGGSTNMPKKFPLWKILTSTAAWAPAIATIGNTLNHFIFINQLPTYLKDILHLSIEENGIFSSLPYLGKYVVAVIGAYVADRMRKNGAVSTKNTRRIFTVVALIIPSLMMISLSVWDQGKVMSIITITALLSIKGCTTSTYLANYLDIAQNLAPTLMGISSTYGAIMGWVGTKLVGVITAEKNDSNAWGLIFIILGGLNIVSATFFIIFVSGEIQEWDSEKEEEAEPLKSEVTIKKDVTAIKSFI